MKTRVICVDLDGTLSDENERRHLRPAAGSPLSLWANFHEACGQDRPLLSVVILIQALATDFQIHIISGRWEKMRPTTEAWLARHHVPYDALRLYTPADTPAKNYTYKVCYVEQLRAQGLNPILFIENEPITAQYIEERGILPVLCVQPGYIVTTDTPQHASDMPDAYRACPDRLSGTKQTIGRY